MEIEGEKFLEEDRKSQSREPWGKTKGFQDAEKKEVSQRRRGG